MLNFHLPSKRPLYGPSPWLWNPREGSLGALAGSRQSKSFTGKPRTGFGSAAARAAVRGRVAGRVRRLTCRHILLRGSRGGRRHTSCAMQLTTHCLINMNSDQHWPLWSRDQRDKDFAATVWWQTVPVQWSAGRDTVLTHHKTKQNGETYCML